MNNEIKEEIETLESVYNETELSIQNESHQKLLLINYLLSLDKYAQITIQFKYDYSSSNSTPNCSISITNSGDTKKIIPIDILNEIQILLTQKYKEEIDCMPIFQCLSYCNDELMDNEELNLSQKLKQLRIISDNNAYLDEMNKYRQKCQQNKKIRPNPNHPNDEKEESNDKNPFRKYLGDTSGAQSLLKKNKFLQSAIPSISWIRSSLETKFSAKNFKIGFIATVKVIEQFLESKNQSKDLSVVYHGTKSQNDVGIINNGLITGGTKGVPIATGRYLGKGIYCSPNVNVAKSYASGSIFICLIRDNGTAKSGDIYVVQSDDDILPIYLASGIFDFSQKTQMNVNNKIIRFEDNFYGNEKLNNRRVQRKWSAFHKLSS